MIRGDDTIAFADAREQKRNVEELTRLGYLATTQWAEDDSYRLSSTALADCSDLL